MADDDVRFRVTQSFRTEQAFVHQPIIIVNAKGQISVLHRGSIIEVPVEDGEPVIERVPGKGEA